MPVSSCLITQVRAVFDWTLWVCTCGAPSLRKCLSAVGSVGTARAPLLLVLILSVLSKP